MANCHFNQYSGNVPVGVVTDLNNKILIANMAENASTNYAKSNGEWLVSGARTMITRFWASSTASIFIVPHMPSIYNTCPPLPEGIGIEREFALWLGYIETIRRVTTDDLKEGNLIRVFIGVIDNVKSTAAAAGGYTVHLQARDRVKWLMDSDVYYSVHEITKVFKTTIADSDNMGVPRSLLIHDVARRAIGGPPQDTVDTGLDAEKYRAKKSIEYDDESEDVSLSPESQVNPYKFHKLGDKPLASKLTTTDPVAPNPMLRVITTRISIGGEYDKDYDPITKYAGLAFLLTGQVALDVIKSIAFQEVYPTEFFQDSRDGNLYYVPRANDSSGLQDPERFYRTYFFKTPYKENLTFNTIEEDTLVTNNPDLIYAEDLGNIFRATKESSVVNGEQVEVPGFIAKTINIQIKDGRNTPKTVSEVFYLKTESTQSEDELVKLATELYESFKPIDISKVSNEPKPPDTTTAPSVSIKTTSEEKKLYISQCQDLIAYREEFSSIGMKTNFLVSVSSPMSAAVPHEDLVLHLATNPYALRGVDYAPKFQRINDPTLKTAEEATVVALSSARIWGKETNVAMTVMLGDPSIVPGEVIQVIGSPIIEEGGALRVKSDREKYYEWETNSNQMIKDYTQFSSLTAKVRAKDKDKYPDINELLPNELEYIKQVPNERGKYIAKLYDGSIVVVNIANQKKENGWSWLPWVSEDNGISTDIDAQGNLEKLMSDLRSEHYGADNTDQDIEKDLGFEELPRTIFRVEAVSHKFNLGSPGYITELALVSPF